jgi:glycosyltransferase involved in cell wall biosynthesis
MSELRPSFGGHALGIAEDRPPRIAVLIPCHNEEITIGKVVSEFCAALPSAKVFVYDNNSSDDTSGVAQKAGALVRREARQGKGNVVRRMFADIEADVYVLVDGDDTYDAAASTALVGRLIEERLDFINGMRFRPLRMPTGPAIGSAIGY